MAQPSVCTICGSVHTDHFQYNKQSLTRCRDCGIVYNTEMPSLEDVAQYYSEDYTLTLDDRTLASERRRIFRLPEQVKLMAEIHTVKPAPASVLDVGCDRGFFLDEARRYGYNVQGLELSDEARAYCKTIAVPVVRDMASLPLKAYDIAVMWHALEHFLQPLDFLKELHDRMSPDGVLFIRVPDFNSFWSRILKARWKWFQPEKHCFHFTAESLRNTITRAGFSVKSIVSRHPNTMLTRRAWFISNTTFGHYWHAHSTLRQRLADMYEDVTCSELFAIANVS